jgi:hypothetical protein
MKLTLAILGEYVMTIFRIIRTTFSIPIIIAGLVIAQILAWLKI